jgi:hypothetical protein
MQAFAEAISYNNVLEILDLRGNAMTPKSGEKLLEGLISNSDRKLSGHTKDHFIMGSSITRIGIGQTFLSFHYSSLPDVIVCTKMGIEEGIAIVFAGILSAVMSNRMVIVGPDLPRNEDGQILGLMELDLRQNNIGEEGGQALFHALTSSHSTIKFVQFGRVSVSNTKLSLLDYANDLKTEIDMSNRDFHNGEATFIMRCIDFYSLTQLETLRLSNNWLTELPGEILGNLTSLQMLDVSFNNIRKLPASILKLRKSLRYIRRGGNLSMVEPPVDIGDDIEKIMEYFELKGKLNLDSKEENQNPAGDPNEFIISALLQMNGYLQKNQLRCIDLFRNRHFNTSLLKGDAVLDMAEFEITLRLMGIELSEDKVKRVMSFIDSDCNDEVDAWELDSILKKLKQKNQSFVLKKVETYTPKRPEKPQKRQKHKSKLEFPGSVGLNRTQRQNIRSVGLNQTPMQNIQAVLATRVSEKEDEISGPMLVSQDQDEDRSKVKKRSALPQILRR